MGAGPNSADPLLGAVTGFVGPGSVGWTRVCWLDHLGLGDGPRVHHPR
jgi:hypothetical protein